MAIVPSPMPSMTTEQVSDFHLRVLASNNPEECWPWSKSKRYWDYGRFTVNGKSYGSHRLAYYIATGVDPGALFVCHKCDHPWCCNPNHLFLGTAQDNADDCWRKGRTHTVARPLLSMVERFPGKRAMTPEEDKLYEILKPQYPNLNYHQMRELAKEIALRMKAGVIDCGLKIE